MVVNHWKPISVTVLIGNPTGHTSVTQTDNFMNRFTYRVDTCANRIGIFSGATGENGGARRYLEKGQILRNVQKIW